MTGRLTAGATATAGRARLVSVAARPLRALADPEPEAAAPTGPGPEVLGLLGRSDAELLAADLAADPAERFVHAHLAALRAAAALVAARGAVRRGRPRPVWELVDAVEPELGAWTARFAAAAGLRAAAETGRGDVDPARADRAVLDATTFASLVRDLLDGEPARRAS
jgi:hypothetical protein